MNLGLHGTVGEKQHTSDYLLPTWLTLKQQQLRTMHSNGGC